MLSLPLEIFGDSAVTSLWPPFALSCIRLFVLYLLAVRKCSPLHASRGSETSKCLVGAPRGSPTKTIHPLEQQGSKEHLLGERTVVGYSEQILQTVGLVNNRSVPFHASRARKPHS